MARSIRALACVFASLLLACGSSRDASNADPVGGPSDAPARTLSRDGPDGLVRIALKKRFSDGTFAVDLDPLSLLTRLCASVPPPRFHATAASEAGETLRKTGKKGEACEAYKLFMELAPPTHLDRRDAVKAMNESGCPQER